MISKIVVLVTLFSLSLLAQPKVDFNLNPIDNKKRVNYVDLDYSADIIKKKVKKFLPFTKVLKTKRNNFFNDSVYDLYLNTGEIVSYNPRTNILFVGSMVKIGNGGGVN